MNLGKLARRHVKTTEPLRYDWANIGRADQQMPKGDDWSTLLLLAGRGFGKTRTLVELTSIAVKSGMTKRPIIAGRTIADVRDVLVLGESGFLNSGDPSFRPVYNANRRSLTWPNGVSAVLLSADVPDGARGLQSDLAVLDELASWHRVNQANNLYANIRLGLRLGQRPRSLIATTPRPIPLLKSLLANPGTYVVRGKTSDNAANLAPSFVAEMVALYAGTRFGAQELNAELLSDADGALWTGEILSNSRVGVSPELSYTVVGVDPSVGMGQGDACGIVVAGVAHDGHAYVLADFTVNASPAVWAAKVAEVFRLFDADVVVAESNQGGEMVRQTLLSADTTLPVKLVHASKGKRARAEPISLIYEQAWCHHVGVLAALETEMLSWSPLSEDSPNRIDALVWAVTELLPFVRKAQIKHIQLGGTEEEVRQRAIAAENQADRERRGKKYQGRSGRFG